MDESIYCPMVGNMVELYVQDLHDEQGIIELQVVSEVNHLVAVVKMVYVNLVPIVDYLELAVALPLPYVINEVVFSDHRATIHFKVIGEGF